MKKKNCLFLLLLSAGLATHAQSGWLVTTPLPDDIKYTIIRQYQDDQSVIYISTATDCYFAWSDNQTMVNLFSIDCGYVVNDFEIYGDTVCFCGHYNGTPTYGLVGWFCIPDLLASTDGFHLFYYQFETAAYGSSVSTSFVVNFNDLTVFKGEDPGLLHVALVGETKDNESCVVELKGVFQTNTWSYTSGTSHPHAGTLTQVVETDNYIAVGGIGLSIDQVSTVHRAFYKNNMFASPCLGDWLYRYTGGQYPTCTYPVGSFKMTAMDGDTVATTSLFLDIAPSYPNITGFATHIINVPDLWGTPVGSTCTDNALVYISNLAGKCGVNRLTYSSPMRLLAELVWSNNPLTGNGSVMGEQPLPASPTALVYSSVQDYYFHDHDNFFGQTGYIASGINTQAPNELSIYTQELNFPGMQCGMMGSTVTVKANFGRKDHDEYPLGIYSDSFDFFDKAPAEKLTFQLDFRCIEQ